MKADSTTRTPNCCSLYATQIIPVQMFLVEKRLLIIDQRNVAPGRIYSGGEGAGAALNEKSKMNYASP